MKKSIKVVLIIMLMTISIKIVKAEEIGNSAFDDANFYKCVVEAYNTKNSAQKTIQDNLTDDELQTITSLSCSGYGKQDSEKISSVKGLEKLTKLTSLNLSGNNLNSIDVTKNTLLTDLRLTQNYISEIDVSANTELITLYLGNSYFDNYNSINKINLQNNTKLTTLDLGGNNLSTIDLSKNVELTYLNLEGNILNSIDVIHNTKLIQLYLNNWGNYSTKNNITEINLQNNTQLTHLGLGWNKISEIDLSKNTQLTQLRLSGNNLNTIDVRANIKLTELKLDNNKLKTLNVVQNTLLTDLDVGGNNLNTIDVTNNVQLKNLYLDDNNILALNLSKNSNIIVNKQFPFDISPQSRTFNLTKENNIYQLDLKKYDNNLDPSKVVFTPIDGVTYDNKTGIFTFTKEVKNISYTYKTGLPSSTGVSEDMEVKLTLNYPNEEKPQEEIKKDEYVDQKADSVQTGTMTIGIITLCGVIIYLVYYLIVKRKNKLYKL